MRKQNQEREKINASIAKNIASLRKAKNMTQVELGILIGVSGDNVSHYEAGRRSPEAYRLFRIAKALKVSVDEILGLEL